MAVGCGRCSSRTHHHVNARPASDVPQADGIAADVHRRKLDDRGPSRRREGLELSDDGVDVVEAEVVGEGVAVHNRPLTHRRCERGDRVTVRIVGGLLEVGNDEVDKQVLVGQRDPDFLDRDRTENGLDVVRSHHRGLG